MRRWIFACLLTACATAPRPPTTPRAQLASLAWLRGRWCVSSEPGAFCEVWRDDVDGALVGEGTVAVAAGRLRVERLRLAVRGDAVYYLATPLYAGETAFRLTRCSADEAVFENPEHDAPKRIVYRRVSRDAIEAVLDGGGAREVFALSRAAEGPHEPPTFDAEPRRLDAALQCRDLDARETRHDAPTVSLGLNTGGDQGRLVQAGIIVALEAGGRVCTAQVASCERAFVGEGAACDGEPVCVRLVGDTVTVERRGAVVFRDRAPRADYVDEGAISCRR